MIAVVMSTAIIMNVAFGGIPLTPPAIALEAGALTVFARSWFVGISLSADSVRCASWLFTREYSWREIRRVDAETYDGLLWIGGPFSASVAMIAFTLVNDRRFHVRATIGPVRALIRQAKELNDEVRRRDRIGPAI